ncbi:MAG: polysaccharide deacetylase family protein [Oscillospiraceae bacterium]
MNIFIVTKKQLGMFLLVMVFISTAVVASFAMNKVDFTATIPKKLPIYAVNTEEKKIALTLDCAWENSDTQTLIELFEKNSIKATFFMTGDFCERYPDDVKLIYAKGHAIENHSYNHPHVASISAEKLLEDTNKCDEIIMNLTGKKPTLYRAPYGEYSNSMLDTFEKSLQHKVIQWDVDSIDWKGREAPEMVETVIKKVKNGSIILFHNDTKNTPQALEQIIPQLKGEGYEFVLVNDLIYQDNFRLDHEGRQVKLP